MVVLFLLSPLPSFAQIPVTDVANLAEQIVHYSQMLLEYERQFEQLTEAQNQVEAITVGLLDQIRAEVGDDPADWLPLFHQRRHS